jgi:hypothetical protein
MAVNDAAAQLDGFIDKFAPEVAAQARFLLERLRSRLPGATVLVYDNYNALAIGFATGERVKDVVLSLAVYPKWCSIFFAGGPHYDDPHGLLEGEGGTVRHIKLRPPALIDDPLVEALIAQAVARATPPFEPDAPSRLVIKSISAKQRPRRP